MRTRRDRPEGLVLAALVGVALVLFAKAPTLPDYVPGRDAPAASGRGTPVQDFAYIFNYARGAAAERGTSPYSVAAHRRFLTGWLGPHVESALCFAYTPTTVLLLAPLFPLATAWAWLVWNTVSAWLAVWGVRATAAGDRRLLRLGCLALASPAAFYCFVLGQTALLTLGVLALLVCSARSDERAGWKPALCLVVLTMKPPLAVVGGAALLAAARWRPLVVAAGLSVATLALAIAWWGVDVIADYRVLVANYDLVNAEPLFRMGFHPEVMSNLRNVLLHTGRFDDAAAAGLTWYPFAACLAVPALLAAAGRRPVRLEVAAAWAAMSYLLFSPHLTPTEDLLLIGVMLWLWADCDARDRRTLAALCVGLQLVGGSTAALMLRLGIAPTVASVVPLIVFAAKLVVAVIAARALAAAALRRASVSEAAIG